MDYSVYLKGELIGKTAFEDGDPAMGIVHGKFHANKIYSSSKTLFLSLTKDYSAQQPLSVRLPDNSVLPLNIVAITDYSDETGYGEDIEIEATLVSVEAYREHFSHHMESYEKQFTC